MASIPRVVKKRTEENRQREKEKIWGFRHHDVVWPLTSSCLAQNVMIPSLPGLTLPLVFQRARQLNKDEKFTRGEKRVMSQVMLTVQYVLVFLVAQRVQEWPSWEKGLCFVPWGFSPIKMKTWENGLTAKLPYHSLFTPLLPLPPHPEAIWGHSYPKIHGHIK